MVVWVRRDQKCGRRRVEHLVASFVCLLIIMIVLLKGPDQPRLGAEAAQNLEMIIDKGSARVPLKLLVYLIVA